ncbi:serine O-acetyltransferase [Mesoflavibacter zeaxanthinifaciens]|uniref:serine O-acetyltransferase n=1 Tax=Mesoflavibacter zeaxanthinifaciens TaxID=393060 RepID=UPI003A92009C
MCYPIDKYFIIDIHTKLGKGVQLAHPYSTILNAESIGENLYVNHLVTVGEKNGKKPRLGDNVQLHAGCMIIGGITIGSNVEIGAGAVVVKDVPNNAIVVGNPSRVIAYKS